MATLMEKDALLNGASQCIAFLSNIIDNCSVSSHQDSGDALKRLVSYRDYLYSTPAELVDFTQGKILLQQVRTQYQHEFNNTGFAPIFPDICYHLTHYKPAAADIPV
ncbi:zeta toxin, partial [Escherichia coli]